MKDSDTTVAETKSRRGPWKRFTNSKVAVGALSFTLLVVVGAVLATMLLPRSVDVSVTVTPIGDYAFDQSCRPINSKSDLENAVEAIVSDVNNVPLTNLSVKGDWEPVGKNCLFKGSFTVPKEAAVVNFRMTAEDETFWLEGKKPIEDKPLAVTASVGQTYTIWGQAKVSQRVSPGTCVSRLFEFDCGNIVNSAFEGCSGAGGFSDLSAGTPVTFFDAAGGVLGADQLVGGKNVEFSDNGSRVSCVLKFHLADVPGYESYTIQIGRRGKTFYTFKEMQSLNWNVHLEIRD